MKITGYTCNYPFEKKEEKKKKKEKEKKERGKKANVWGKIKPMW